MPRHLHTRRTHGGKMKPDPVITEVRKIKEEIAAQYGFDVRKLGEALMREQEASGREIVRLEPRPAKTA